MGSKVIVGMSGGVDSSVAAWLLKQEGYDVIGVTMQIWQDEAESAETGDCCGLTAVNDARRVADSLDIPYYVLNFKKEFKRDVMDYFVAEYLRGRTPNPCIACNRYVKWEALLTKALALGADYIATGHYANIITLPNGRLALAAAKTAAKDQSYALYKLTQEQLRHTLMPAGAYTKEEVRRIAADIGLSVADKPDSQEICFIPDNDYGRFIGGSISGGAEPCGGIKPGDFVNTCGEKIGKHKGIAYYTVGQRKGLGVTFGKPMYVKELRLSDNQVVLAEDAELYEYELTASELNFMGAEEADFRTEQEVMAKIRYSHKKAKALVKITDEGLFCRFEEAQRAITPGQAVVFYKGEYIVAGGTIQK